MNNLRRDFGTIQRRAQARLAKRRRVDLAQVEWRIGCLHDLRKSFGSHAAKSVSMHELKRLMGHSSITVTEQFYTQVDADLSAKLAKAFAA